MNGDRGTVTDAVIVEVHDEIAKQALRDILKELEWIDPLQRNAWPLKVRLEAIERLAKAGLEENQK